LFRSLLTGLILFRFCTLSLNAVDSDQISLEDKTYTVIEMPPASAAHALLDLERELVVTQAKTQALGLTIPLALSGISNFYDTVYSIYTNSPGEFDNTEFAELAAAVPAYQSTLSSLGVLLTDVETDLDSYDRTIQDVLTEAEFDAYTNRVSQWLSDNEASVRLSYYNALQQAYQIKAIAELNNGLATSVYRPWLNHNKEAWDYSTGLENQAGDIELLANGSITFTNGYEFASSNAYLYGTNALSTNTASELSVVARVKLESIENIPTGGAWVVSQGTDFGLYLDTSTNWVFYSEHGTGTKSVSSTNVLTNQWQLLVGSVSDGYGDTGDVRLGVGGGVSETNFTDLSSANIPIRAITNGFRIGSHVGGSTNDNTAYQFPGAIDVVYVSEQSYAGQINNLLLDYFEGLRPLNLNPGFSELIAALEALTFEWSDETLITNRPSDTLPDIPEYTPPDVEVLTPPIVMYIPSPITTNTTLQLPTNAFYHTLSSYTEDDSITNYTYNVDSTDGIFYIESVPGVVTGGVYVSFIMD